MSKKENIGVNVVMNENNQAWVELKPIVEKLGLNWIEEQIKLRDMKDKGVKILTFPVLTSKGAEESVLIALEHLPVYLYSIDAARVKPELRESIINFQRQTTKGVFGGE